MKEKILVFPDARASFVSYLRREAALRRYEELRRKRKTLCEVPAVPCFEGEIPGQKRARNEKAPAAPEDPKHTS